MFVDRVPGACTLPTEDRPLRASEFKDLFQRVQRLTRHRPTRLDLTLPADLEPAARDLARRENECCSFFAFTFDADDDAVVMHIDVPPNQIEVLDAIERAQSQ